MPSTLLNQLPVSGFFGFVVVFENILEYRDALFCVPLPV
jgi:hypothetical protein